MVFDLKWTTAMAAALLASGCNRAKADDNWTADRDTAICTDAQGVRLPDDRCRQHRVGGGGGGAFWYFLGRGRSIPYYGERATGGSFRAATGARWLRAVRQRHDPIRRRQPWRLRQFGKPLRQHPRMIRQTLTRDPTGRPRSRRWA